jgi:hypothetical protein
MEKYIKRHNNYNLYVSNVGVPNFIKHIQLDFKTQIDPNEVVVETSIFLYYQQIGCTDKMSTRKL